MAWVHVLAHAQDGAMRPSSDDVVFRPYAERGTDSNVQLINGVRAEKKDWLTVLNATLTKPGVAPPVTCTGIFVGPGVFLTAAHCFDQGPGRPLRDSVWVSVGGQDIQATCAVSDEYLDAVNRQVWNFVKPRVSTDYALCSFALPAVMPNILVGLQNDNVDGSTPLISGTPVLMTGYGCTSAAILASPATGDLKLDGLLRIGDAAIFSVPASGVDAAEGFVQIHSSLKSAPALCPGDSGGPLISGATTSNQSGTRRIRGVNSSVQLGLAQDATKIAISRVTPLATASFKTFSSRWLEQNKERTICGLNGTPGFLPCRD
jgi:secreted trypsin-like serine protease